MNDLENCPSQILHLMNHLKQYTQIVLCYAQSGAKIPLDWMIPLSDAVKSNRLRIIKMQNGGKNAADFGIAFWAGFLMGQSPVDAHFDIVSDDADLDHVVCLLHEHERSANRIRTQKENSQVAAKVIRLSNSTQENHLHQYCLHLNTHQKNRPVKKDAMLNQIKSKFNDAGINTEKLFEDLCKQGAVKIIDNRISYNELKINELARKAA